MEDKKPTEIKIVSGDGSELDISDVKKHLDIESPKQKDTKKEVIIPSEKKDLKNDK